MADQFTVDIDFTCTASGPRRAFPRPFTVDIDFACWVPPSSTKWKAALTDKDGAIVAWIKDPGWSRIEDVLNTTGTTTATLTPGAAEHARAMAAVLDADRLPELELRIWRGDVTMFWGPIFDDDTDAISQGVLHASDASEHLNHTPIGDLGAPEYLRNADLSDGLQWWQQVALYLPEGVDMFQSQLTGSELSVGYSVNVPGGGLVLQAEAPPDETIIVHWFQEFEVVAPTQRDITLRAYSFVWVPSDGVFGLPNAYAPNVKRYGLSLVAIDPAASKPASYFQGDLQFDVLPGEIQFDRWLPQYAELKLPAGRTYRIHAGFSAPQGRSFWTGMHVGSDAGHEFLSVDPLSIVDQLVGFYGERHNITPDASNRSPNSITRSFPYEEHTSTLGAVNDLARVGWLDWAMRYAGHSRCLVPYWPRKGARRPRCNVVIREDGRGNVAGFRRSRMWSRGATGVEAQTSTGKHRYTAAAFADPGVEPRWSDVYTVDREIDPLELPRHARERLVVDGKPETLEFTCYPGDDKFVVGLQKGDTIHVESAWPPLPVSGDYRVVARSTDPVTDTVAFTVNPDPGVRR